MAVLAEDVIGCCLVAVYLRSEDELRKRLMNQLKNRVCCTRLTSLRVGEVCLLCYCICCATASPTLYYLYF